MRLDTTNFDLRQHMGEAAPMPLFELEALGLRR